MAADPIFEAATAPGTPFAIGEQDGARIFVNGPQTLDQLIESARRHGDAEFIIEGARRLTFADTFALRDALAAHIAIRPGERVAICMANCAEWLVGFMAVIRAGGVAVLLNSRGAPGELAAMVADTSPTLVLADARRAALLREGGYAGRIIDAAEFPQAGSSFDPPSPASPGQPAVIMFTSGTTGRVKGAVLTHRNVVTGIMAMQLAGFMVLLNTAQRIGLDPQVLIANMPQQAVLAVYPLFHISGLGSAFLTPLLAGSKVVILPKWDAKEAASAIAAEGITMLSVVPTMLWDILKHAGDADLSSLRNVGTGGQALPQNLLGGMREKCPEAVIGTGYGLTETTGSIALALGEDFLRKPASAGRVLPLVDVRIEDAQGTALPAGEAGEIVVRGAQVMQGYWDLPGETAEVLSGDGWFRTGDIGMVDEEGYIFIVDRKKDMVISGGENIYCAEVERVLSEMPQVTECAAFGIPDERMGEALVAAVRADGVDGEAIKVFVAGRLARYKVPVHIAFWDGALPRNHLDKVDKIALRRAWPDMSGEKA